MTIDLRRLEEISQNASRPDRGLMIDGWSVGLSPGLAKRSAASTRFTGRLVRSRSTHRSEARICAGTFAVHFSDNAICMTGIRPTP